jgi:uncharacterized membrane protein
MLDASDAAPAAAASDDAPRFRLSHIAAAITISLRSGRCRTGSRRDSNIPHYNLIVITVITVVVVNIAPRQFARLEGDFALGMLCMYAFFAMIGAGTDAVTFLHEAPILFFYCTFMLVVQFVVVLLAARLFKFDLADVVIGSGAAIVGRPPLPALRWPRAGRRTVTPGIAMGMLGKVIANFIGIAIAKWLS